MPKKISIPRKLKVAADPRAAFQELEALGRDLPGARAWGTAERGFTVNLGAGFDFGPILTCGAPVVTAEVGAQVSIGAAQNLVVLLDRDAENKLTLSKLSGWSASLMGLVEAKAGVGIPDDWAAAGGAMVPEVPTFGVKSVIEEKTVGNPLVEEEPEEEEPEAPEAESDSTPLANEVSVANGLNDKNDPAPGEDAIDLALESLQDDDDAGRESSDHSPPDSPADLAEPSADNADNADNVIDLHVMGKVELSAGVRYLIVRDPAPERHVSLAGVDDAMKAFISNSEKAALKEEIEEFIAENTMDADSAGTAGLLGNTANAVNSALRWMQLFPEASQSEAWTSLNNKLLACQALAPTALGALRQKLEQVFVLKRENWRLDSGKLPLRSLENFGGHILKRQKSRVNAWDASILFPDYLDYGKANSFNSTYEQYFKNGQWTDAGQKADWKMGTKSLLRHTFGDLTTTAQLADALERTIEAGKNSFYEPNPAMPKAGALPLYDKVKELKIHITALGLAFTGADKAITDSIEVATKAVLKSFRQFLKNNASSVTNPPETKFVGTRSTADLVRKLNEIFQNKPDLKLATEYAYTLTKLKDAERSEVKNRAVAMLLKAGMANNLPAWPSSPSAQQLIGQLKAIQNKPTSGIAGAAVTQLIADLTTLEEDKQREKQLNDDPTSKLTYISLLGFRGGGAASAVAKAKARYAIGVNELGIHAKAGAEAQFSTEAINVRTQGFSEKKDGSKMIQTQDVKIRRWAASAEAAAELKLGNKTVGETGTALKESGRIRWSGATGRWKLPSAGTTRVALDPGSGVCFGRSAGRERFSEKMKALREQNAALLAPPPPKVAADKSKTGAGGTGSPATAAPQPVPTPYVERLARALRVNEKALTRCLLQLFPTPEDEAALGEHEMLYLESRWTCPKGNFKLRTKQSVINAVNSKLTSSKPDKQTPPPEINDLRKALVPEFKKWTKVYKKINPAKKRPFVLQSIAIRVRLGDEPEEKEKTLFQLGHEYIVVAMASVVKREATRTVSMPDAVVWWANPKFRQIEAGDDLAAKEKLYQQAVPPLFLLDV